MAIDPDDIHAQYNAACVYALLGETDRAIDILESYLAHASGERKRWFIHDSDLDPIRDHPRYQKLLEITR
jgi:adenylate cyclase